MAKMGRIEPGRPGLPVVWATCGQLRSPEEDMRAMAADGVGLISRHAASREAAATALDIARKTGMKYHTHLSDITEHAHLVEQAGQKPVPALMIGGVYRGKAIDRHVFAFAPTRHQVIIEPPVYSRDLPYTKRIGEGDGWKETEPFAHYFPEMGPPLRAEVVVPLGSFDGRQHLKILPAAIDQAPAGTVLEADSVAPDLPRASEILDRKLYRLSFDLTGLEDALLDKVGLAVYWPYGGSKKYWMFGTGEVSAAADSTREALKFHVQAALQPWIDANGGTFPSDVVIALRYGDECWHVTGHLNGPAVSYPLWDFSDPSIAAFAARTGSLEYPRTWGFPEIYGPDSYAWWMYLLHQQCAELAGLIRRQISSLAPGLLLFRNQTRAGVFKLTNDHDGSGQELLTRNLDLVHLDPYPVRASGYTQEIPRDMSYCAGLARRYGRPLVPWIQAHTYGYPDMLVDPSPDDVDRMAQEQCAQGVDAIMWLGWGESYTFPQRRPESWRRAVAFHKRLADSLPPKPKARLAVLRPYRIRALLSLCDGRFRNPADWLMQQFLEVWAVRHGQPYDVFELPPGQDEDQASSVRAELAGYEFIVSTQPHPGAWVIGEGTEGQQIDPADSDSVCQQFQQQLIERGWLGPPA